MGQTSHMGRSPGQDTDRNHGGCSHQRDSDYNKGSAAPQTLYVGDSSYIAPWSFTDWLTKIPRPNYWR